MTTHSPPEQAPDPEPATDAAPGRARSGLVVLVAAAVLLAAAGGLAAFALRGSVEVPGILVSRAEAGLMRALGGAADAELGGIELSLTDSGRPRMVLRDLTLRAANSVDSVTLPAFEVTLARRALMRAEIRPESLRLDGARLRLSRDKTGILSLALQSGETLTEVPSLPALISELEAVFDRPGWRALRTVTLSDLTLDLADARIRDVFTLSGGEAALEIGEADLSLALSLDLPGQDGAGGDLRFTTRKGVPETALALRLDAVPAELLARQAPALAPLAAFDGAVSGRVTGKLALDGAIASLGGDLTLGAGYVTLAEGTEPIRVDAAAARWSYVTGRPRLRLDALSLQSERLRFRGTGYLEAVPFATFGSASEGEQPDETVPLLPDLLVQLDIREPWLDLRPKFATPSALSRVLVEGRWGAATRQFDLAQIVAQDGQTETQARGHGVVRLPRGEPPTAQFEVTAPSLPAHRVLDFWPQKGRGEKAGAWLRRNLLAGTLENVSATMRVELGQRPKMSASFDFRDADVQILPSFPPLLGARGHGTLFDHRFTIQASEGTMTTAQAGNVDLAGSSFQVPNTRIRGGDANLGFMVGASVPAAFAVLDLPPIRLLDRVKLPAEKLSGAVQAQGALTVPLRKGGKVDLSTLDVAVELSDVVFDEVAPDKDFAAPALRLRIVDGEVMLEGRGALEDVPIDLALARGLATPAANGTQISGQAQLTSEGLAALGVVLPAGMLSGTAAAEYVLSFAPDQVPRLEVRSDLAGAVLRIPQLSWSKPASREADLTLALRLGPAPEVEAFALTAPGLAAEGRIRLRPASDDAPAALDRIVLDRLRVGDWLDVAAVLTGRGAGALPAVSVTSGRLDLRALSGSGTPVGAGAGAGRATPPLAVALDRVDVTDGIALTSVRGTVRSAGAFEGTLSGRVNGGSQVRVDLSSTALGTQGVRVLSADGGAVLRDAGVLKTLRGGALDLRLTTRANRPIIDGTLQIENARMVETPAAVQFLSAISVVGLLDQMANGGIAFTDIATELSLSPEGVTLREGRANGPALGITFEGVVMPRRKQLDLQGVVSPVYMLNAIPGALLARRGEGLVGVTYRLQGALSDPRIQVNPLTLLTPGVFRDLFRRAPPDLTQ